MGPVELWAFLQKFHFIPEYDASKIEESDARTHHIAHTLVTLPTCVFRSSFMELSHMYESRALDLFLI